MDLPSWFVCVIGLGTVFAGLIFLILICRLVSVFAAERPKAQPALTTASPQGTPAVIENRGEVVAAISAAIAEDLGEDVSHIRILSINKI